MSFHILNVISHTQCHVYTQYHFPPQEGEAPRDRDAAIHVTGIGGTHDHDNDNDNENTRDDNNSNSALDAFLDGSIDPLAGV